VAAIRPNGNPRPSDRCSSVAVQPALFYRRPDVEPPSDRLVREIRRYGARGNGSPAAGDLGFGTCRRCSEIQFVYTVAGRGQYLHIDLDADVLVV
jgi:hypothetical protein